MNPATGGRVQDTAFPLQRQRVDVSIRPTKDDCERAKDKARQLLRSILPEEVWTEFEDKEIIKISGKRGVYVISAYSQTEIRDLGSGRCITYACLQLSIPAPTYDRMVAEYLLVKNAEDVYWKTANIFERDGNELGIAMLFIIVFDVALFVNLLL